MVIVFWIFLGCAQPRGCSCLFLSSRLLQSGGFHHHHHRRRHHQPSFRIGRGEGFLSFPPPSFSIINKRTTILCSSGSSKNQSWPHKMNCQDLDTSPSPVPTQVWAFDFPSEKRKKEKLILLRGNFFSLCLPCNQKRKSRRMCVCGRWGDGPYTQSNRRELAPREYRLGFRSGRKCLEFFFFSLHCKFLFSPHLYSYTSYP